MRVSILTSRRVLAGYNEVSGLYPHIPPLALWRAFELAAFRTMTLREPVLDVGCGDGRFFRLLWPRVRQAFGIELDPAVAVAARTSGVYREVLQGAADLVDLSPARFASAFANCSLEHMDRLSGVLSNIHRTLRPGGAFLLSVVTDHLLTWATLPPLAVLLAAPTTAIELQSAYRAYHHLVNAVSVAAWTDRLMQAGFEVEELIPIVPEVTSRVFLFLDHLWHLPSGPGEFGSAFQSFLENTRVFPEAFKLILSGLLEMERDWTVGSGAVFAARRPA